MGGFYWLASYPKSGNTWLRLALHSLSRGGAPPDFTDETTFAPIASARRVFDHWLDVESSDLTGDEVSVLRPRLYEAKARDVQGPLVRKVHDAWTMTPAGEPLFPPAVTLGAIVVVRDPRDVAVSLAHHMSVSLDAAVAFMADPDAAFSASAQRGSRQFRQHLLTWSGHVASWLDAPVPSPLPLRYEDMLADPAASLMRAARYMGWTVTPEAVRRAAEATSFDALRSAEDRHGFLEKPVEIDRFFRRGIAGGWRDTLSAAQASRIERDHAAVMARLGYA